jgi:hypothetical protein
MRLLIFLILIFLTSCGAEFPLHVLDKKVNSPNDPRKFKSTDTTFQQEIDLFTDGYRLKHGYDLDIENIPVNFGNTKTKKYKSIVLCYRYWYGSTVWKEIIIDKTYWNQASKLQRENLIKHEFGHCALDRDHDDHRHNGIATSIMNTYILSEEDFDQHFQAYNHELFTSDKKVIIESINSI